jgi:hypothetical protein
MSWFHGFVSGNGRKPFRLAPCPIAKPLQGVVAELVVTAVIVADADLVLSAALVAETVYEPAAIGAV